MVWPWSESYYYSLAGHLSPVIGLVGRINIAKEIKRHRQGFYKDISDISSIDRLSGWNQWWSHKGQMNVMKGIFEDYTKLTVLVWRYHFYPIYEVWLSSELKNNIDNLDEVGPDPAVSVSVRPSNWGLGGLCLYFLFSGPQKKLKRPITPSWLYYFIASRNWGGYKMGNNWSEIFATKLGKISEGNKSWRTLKGWAVGKSKNLEPWRQQRALLSDFIWCLKKIGRKKQESGAI